MTYAGVTRQRTANTIVSTTNDLNNKTQRARRQQEIRFFKQSALNVFSLQVIVEKSIILIGHFLQAMTISFHVLALIWDKPIGYFILAQAPLAVYHGSNALTMLSIHRDLRRLIWSQIKDGLMCYCH